MSASIDNSTKKPNNWGPRGTAAATFGASLSFKDVSLSYRTVEAVKNVSFELKPGEIVCLLGPSGCGKTSLLRMAAGIQTPSAGEICLGGQVISGPGVHVPPEKRNIGLMFQDFALFPHLNILDNVSFGLRNLDKTEQLKEARLALGRVGLARYEAGYPNMLSGGEQQRVALARALVPRPAVMLMDEPFSGLDQRLRESVRQETLALLRETRATCLLVTHDPAEALGMSDRILLMRQGRLMQSGPPQALYNQPVDVEAARFFSDVNELSGRVVDGKVETALGKFAANEFNHGQEVDVLVRPQGIRLRRENEPGLKGYILSSRFLGDLYELAVQFEGHEAPVIARTALSTPPRRGQAETFTIEPAHVLVFESDVS